MTRALVIGAGIGGLCAAIGLRQKQIEVDLIEKEPVWRVAGVGIIHQTNAVRAEAMLGVAEEVIAQGWAFSGGRIHNEAGVLLHEIPAPPTGGLPADVGITRARLAAILLMRAETLGARLRTGVTAEVVGNGEDGAEARFANGESATYDLVVGADGIYSATRENLWGHDYRARFAGQGAWRYNMPRPAELTQVWLFVRKGPNAGMMPLAPDLMYMWCTSNEATADWKQDRDLAADMRALLASLGGVAGEMRDKYLTNSAEVLYRPFEYVDLPRPWHKGSVVLIGDAAHATTAHLAQGAAMAMEDAVVLGEEIGKGGPVPDALARWEERRYARCAWISQKSLAICRAEQGKAEDPEFNVLQTMIESRQRAMAPL